MSVTIRCDRCGAVGARNISVTVRHTERAGITSYLDGCKVCIDKIDFLVREFWNLHDNKGE